MPRTLFVTTALPYANASFHIGHIMEYIQADVWVRFMRLQGHTVHFVGADDAHGAPIMLKAEELGISPSELVARVAADRPLYLDGFHIEFDHWYTTDSAENVELSQAIYRSLVAEGLIATREVEQYFDPVKQMFLPDRYIKGECPNCHSKDQNGDNCEVCGTVYAATALISPYSILSGAKPELRSSKHFFFRLSDPRCVDFLKSWSEGASSSSGQPRLQAEVRNKTSEWLHGPDGANALSDWDISRDAPYFGIPIPDAPGKYFYVWLEAPVGYLATLKNYFDTGKARARSGTEVSFEDLLADPHTEQIHFIGKDIIYHHTLFWPAMLRFSARKVPDAIFVHGFLTVSGEKMSKSRGTGVSPLRYLELGLNAEWLRYYLTAKLNGHVEDIEFDPADFAARVNSDLVGKYVNIASRSASFITRMHDGRVLDIDAHPDWGALAANVAAADIEQAFAARDTARVVRTAMTFADAVNQYFDAQRPWELAKLADNHARLQEVCSVCLRAFQYLTLWLKPILPRLAVEAEAFLQCGALTWGVVAPLQRVQAYRHLMVRVDAKKLDALFDAAVPAGQAPTQEPVGDTIDLAAFQKIDLRVARVVHAEEVAGSDKLVRLDLDLGEGPRRTVFAGIRGHYAMADLIGRYTVIVANLAPRKMRFGVSEGMLLAAGGAPGGSDGSLFLIAPDAGATPGMRIR